MTDYVIVSDPRANLDVEAAFLWYERQRPGLSLELLSELRAAYDRIAGGPLGYQYLRSGIRRALLRRFPYAVYFVVDEKLVVVLAILHTSRDPAEWQRRTDRANNS